MINVIMAVYDWNGRLILGNGNQLPWKIKEELSFFKETTMGGTVVMGYNTAKSLSFKPLVGRTNIVVCDVTKLQMNKEDPLWNAGMMIMDYSDLHVVFNAYKDIFIIGGVKFYSYILEKYIGLVKNFYISYVNKDLCDPKDWDNPIEFTSSMYEVLKKFKFEEHFMIPNKFITLKGTL